MAAAKKNVNLTAKWQLDAALLSRPVDLTALVSMARSHPDKFLDDNTLQRLVTLLLNEKNKSKSDKDTKLDVLNILANVAAGSKKAVAEVPLVCPFSHPLLSALSLLLPFSFCTGPCRLGRRERRSRNSWSPSYVRRCDAGKNHPGVETSEDS